MSIEVIPSDIAKPIRRRKGSTVTFLNQSAVDVYLDAEPNRLNVSVPGTTPSGTKLAANGGQLQIANFTGTRWARAISLTTIEVDGS